MSTITEIQNTDAPKDSRAVINTNFSNLNTDKLESADLTDESVIATGWIPAGETWTYASASTFTISGDKTGKYQKGDKIKLTQTTAKYFYIKSVSYGAPNTTVTVTGGTDYTVANAAITSPYYSKVENPQGFPAPFTVATNVSMLMVGQRVILTGWGYISGNDSTEGVTQSVSFGITFSSPPYVMTSSLAQTNAGATPDSIDDFTGRKSKEITIGYSISTTGFYIEVSIVSSISNASEKYGYAWKAEGEF